MAIGNAQVSACGGAEGVSKDVVFLEVDQCSSKLENLMNGDIRFLNMEQCVRSEYWQNLYTSSLLIADRAQSTIRNRNFLRFLLFS